MVKDAGLYDLTQEIASGIFGVMGAQLRAADPPPEPLPALLQLRGGRAESPAWFLVQATEFDPEPISVARLRVRDIYASERIVLALLELMASEKWLEPINEEEYTLALAGRQVVACIGERRRRALTQAALPLPADELARLEQFLQRLMEAGMAAGDPPGVWCLGHSRRRAPGEDAPTLLRLLHAMADFNAYRDDAHMAAWHPLKLGGQTWEAFSLVWEGTADTAEAIDQQLFYRGYSRREYEAALQELAGRGWLAEIAGQPGHYAVSEDGRQVQEEVERLTNLYFYAPWERLSEAETAEFCRLLARLNEQLQALAATP
ncbi:MAG: DUF1818 family protein [Chloroflexi bacterium]|nr:DUF1818 family protein [Chloroflexota bacterium]MCI0579699.1 DUF1818 family protein [Chloroflexota bacterium]MCI0650052.1 DUF1818 family protein [Chloroflexota bacterium]MCI0727013.1 DUF1818 family protein [Chloroflexota bacterium]